MFIFSKNKYNLLSSKVNSTIQCLIYVACIKLKKWRNLVFIFKSDLSDVPKISVLNIELPTRPIYLGT